MGRYSIPSKESSPLIARFPARQSFKICCVVLCLAVVASSMEINDRAKGKGKKPSKPKPSGKGGSSSGAGGKGGSSSEAGGPDWSDVWDLVNQLEDILREIYEASSGGGSGSEMPSGSGSEMPSGSGSEMPSGSGSGMPSGSGSGMPSGSGS